VVKILSDPRFPLRFPYFSIGTGDLHVCPAMVKVEIVEEKDAQAPAPGPSPYVSPSPSRTASHESLSSISSQLSTEETVFHRIAALIDIIPPGLRHALSSRLSKTASVVKQTGKIAGNVVWIVTTSALLVGLPLALSLEDEAKIVAQEKEMLAQQQGAQQVCRDFF
jgi:import receptor subunit TOM22